MLEFIGAVVVSWWFITALLLGSLWFTHCDEESWAILFLVGTIAILYFGFSLPLNVLGIGLAAYIPMGIIWSVLRWKRYCASYVEDSKEYPSLYDKAKASRDLNPVFQIGKIVSWVFVWPFSFIDNVIGDLIDIVRDFIRKYLIGIYENISKKYIDQIPEKTK